MTDSADKPHIYELIVFERYFVEGEGKFRPYRIAKALAGKDGSFSLFIPPGVSVTGRIVMAPLKRKLKPIDLIAAYKVAAEDTLLADKAESYDLIVFEPYIVKGQSKFRPHRVAKALANKNGTFTLFVPAGISISGRVAMIPRDRKVSDAELIADYKSAADEYGV